MRRPLAYSLAQRIAETAIVLVGLVVLARLLAPEAFGLFATVYASILLVEGFCRTGTVAAIVRLERIDDGRATSAALFAAGAAAGGALLVVGLGVALSLATELHRIVTAALLPLLLGRIALVPVRAVTEAILTRALAFDALCLIGVGAVSANALVAISLAGGGAGAEALGAGALAEGLALALGGALAARRELPRLVRAPLHFGPVARSCWRVSLGGSLAEVSQVTLTTTCTATLGAAATGVYDRARRVVGGFDDLLMNAVRPVVLPVLSERRRSGGHAREAYLFKVASISAVAWAFFGALALLAEPVVLTLLGDGWLETVPVVRTLCLIGIAAPFHLTDGQFLIALDREREYLGIQALSQFATVVLIVLAAPFGLVWLASAIVAGKAIKGFLTTAALRRELALARERLLAAVLPSLATTLSTCAAVAALAALTGLGEARPGSLLAVAALVAVPAFAMPAAALRHPLWLELRVAGRRRITTAAE